MDSGWVDYEVQLGRVTAYIHDHLDDELDLMTLADVACLSAHHWHRVYHALYGETIAATVKRLRLQRAAGYLAQTPLPIEEVARRSGYPNLQSFTRVFKSVYGLPPARYRKHGSHVPYFPRPDPLPPVAHEVNIKILPPLQVVSVDHEGSFMTIGRAFDELFCALSARAKTRAEMRWLALYIDDPTAVAEADLRAKACLHVGAEIAVDPPLAIATIAGGPYAVLRHRGPYADMPAAYNWLFGEWMLRSGRQPADLPVVEEYLNHPRDTPPLELLTDIWLPLQA